MIEYTTGDVLAADVDALVNTVNCVGVMGRGIALQFRNAWPENFRAYAAACERGGVRTGEMFIHATGSLKGPRYIVNFPTKRHWRSKSELADIEAGLTALRRDIERLGIRSIAVPALGAGLGGLSWSLVRARIADALGGLDEVRVIVYEPHSVPADGRGMRTQEVPNMTAGRAAVISLMDRYLAGLLDPMVSLLEVHKLAYFLQEAGQPLRLEVVKGTYGPYATNLRHVLSRIEGHFIRGYVDGGDQPYKPLEILDGVVESARFVVDRDASTRTRLARVGELVDGFESPDGLELLATIHWVATREGARTTEAALAATHAWNERKRRFTARQVGIAHTALEAGGWLGVA